MSVRRVAFGLAAALCLALGFAIPSLGAGIFLSPDETAAAAAARRFAATGAMVFPNPASGAFPWLHPRSFVNQPGERMVPVGFLGLPALVGAASIAIGDLALLLVGPASAALGAWALWRLFRDRPEWERAGAVLAWLSFPPVLLYANRGLYPNLPVVALVLAGLAAWRHASASSSRVLAGFAVGLAAAIRPTEIVWIAAWVAAAAWLERKEGRPRGSGWFFALAGCAVPLVLVAAVHALTYGAPWLVGYALRDPAIVAASATPVAPRWTWPFGFHPRAMWFHIRGYLFGSLLPWTLAVAGAAFAWLWPHRVERKPWRAHPEAWSLFVAGGWTLAAVVLMYGQAVYQDHVGVNVVSSGNSFLRYALPLAPFFALAVGRLVQAARDEVRIPPAVRKPAAAVLVAAFVALGIFQATYRDEEGIAASRRALAGYARIRGEAVSALPPRTTVFSDRSDKIFFTPEAPSVSLMPPLAEIGRFVATGASAAYFGTTEDAAGLARWTEAGLRLESVATFEHQALYRILPLP
jgi:hypothetical protein